MNKIVYNARTGGFGLSIQALYRYSELNPDWKDYLTDVNKRTLEYCFPDYIMDRKIPRHCPYLVQVVEELGTRANGDHADLEICLTAGNKYRVVIEDSGYEWVDFPDNIEWTEI